jgi:hypothetical protein
MKKYKVRWHTADDHELTSWITLKDYKRDQRGDDKSELSPMERAYWKDQDRYKEMPQAVGTGPTRTNPKRKKR